MSEKRGFQNPDGAKDATDHCASGTAFALSAEIKAVGDRRYQFHFVFFLSKHVTSGGGLGSYCAEERFCGSAVRQVVGMTSVTPADSRLLLRQPGGGLDGFRARIKNNEVSMVRLAQDSRH